MNNYTRIKNMSVDEMAEWLNINAAKCLVIKKVSDYTNQDGIKQWLLAECEEQ